MSTFKIIDPLGQVHYDDLKTEDRAVWAATMCLERFRCGVMHIEEYIDGSLLDKKTIARNRDSYVPYFVH